jgi:xanthine dehydrogenase accessory factor
VEDETAWKVGLSCGGRIRVHVGRLERGQPSGYPQSPGDLLASLNAERRGRRPVVVATDLRDGSAQLIRREDEAPRDICEAVRAAFETGRSRHVEAAGQSLFLNAYLPQPRLVVIGAVHISQALVPMARIAGFPVEIIDPRTAFATPERFPEVMLHTSWPQEVFAAQPLESCTALAALTHDPRIDDLPLQAALEAGCFYVGVLGSRKLREQRNERLLAAGVSRDLLGRIRSPIGLNISAANPAEIAVAVLAEVISASRSRSLTSPVHR